jgi:hypothetical protein
VGGERERKREKKRENEYFMLWKLSADSKN